jgi:SAM-dependent methyltransferase
VDEPNRIVASGYDRIAETYEAWMGQRASPNTAPTYYRRFLNECLNLITPGGLVLDLGCGAGRVAAEIGKRARVVGVDISIAQIRLARERVPTGAFLVADMANLEFRSGSFDAIAAFYSVIHVPRDLHAGLLQSLHQWMRPRGVLFGAFGSSDNPDERGEFLGQPMYWSHFDAGTTRGLLVGAGFGIVQDEVVEDQGEHPLWVVATA